MRTAHWQACSNTTQEFTTKRGYRIDSYVNAGGYSSWLQVAAGGLALPRIQAAMLTGAEGQTCMAQVAAATP